MHRNSPSTKLLLVAVFFGLPACIDNNSSDETDAGAGPSRGSGGSGGRRTDASVNGGSGGVRGAADANVAGGPAMPDASGSGSDASTSADSGATSALCQGGIGIPDDVHVAPSDVCVRAVATKQEKLRQIAFAQNGDLYGVTQEGIIRRYRDLNGNGSFESGPPETVDYATTGGNGNNVHIDDVGGYLYAGTPEGVSRWPLPAADDSPADGGAGEPVVVGQPSSGRHPYHTVHLYGGFLYVHSGSADNVDTAGSPNYETERALIKRFPIKSFSANTPFEWKNGELFAIGLRNAVGYTEQPATGDLIAVVNGTDELRYKAQDVHQTNPGEAVVRLSAGGKYGFPYCFSALQITGANGMLVPPGTQLHTEVQGFINAHDDGWCQANSEVPESLLDPHSAPLDVVFLSDVTRALPDRWVGGAFVTLHGSWDKDPPSGEKVIWLPFAHANRATMPTVDSKGPHFDYEVVFGGKRDGAAIDGAWGWSAGGTGEDLVRPVGVAVSPKDGALYVSSDNAPITGAQTDSSIQGALYRISLRR